MRHKIQRLLNYTFILMVILTGCVAPGQSPPKTSIPTFMPTSTLAPTKTPLPTNTPDPPKLINSPHGDLYYVTGDRTITRKILYSSISGSYAFKALGENGQIPFGVVSVLELSNIETNYEIASISIDNQKGVETDSNPFCESDEGTCEVIVNVLPSLEPPSLLDNTPYSFDILVSTTGGMIELNMAGEIFKPFDFEDLAFPIDLDQIADILASDSRLRINYKATNKLDTSCGSGTHLGDGLEIYADFPEGTYGVEAPSYDVIAPLDFNLIGGIQGDNWRRVCFSTFVGWNIIMEPLYYSFIHVTELEKNIKNQFAGGLGVNPSDLEINWQNDDHTLGPYWNLQHEVRVDGGTLIGYKKAPWEWSPNWGPHHSLLLHMLLTKNEPTDNLSPVEANIGLTNHYLNFVIQELVIERDLTIGFETQDADWCTNPLVALDYINPEILEQVRIYQWPDRLHHFDISRK